MKFPSDLNKMVEELTFANKKVLGLQEEIAKLNSWQEKADVVRARLVTALAQHGFTEEAVDLLLAAR